MGHERLDDNASRRLEAFLAAGDPGRQIADVWRAKEAVLCCF
jgi:hypothetical protein